MPERRRQRLRQAFSRWSPIDIDDQVETIATELERILKQTIERGRTDVEHQTDNDAVVERFSEEATSYDPVKIAAIEARKIAREEIASLCGLVLRRMQDDPSEPLAQKMAGAFAEALNDFTSDE